MRFHFATVPIHGSADAEEELNQFLAIHRVIALDRQLVADGSRSAWAICVTYVDPGSAGRSVNTTSPNAMTDPSKAGRIDYREILSESDFHVFAKLRDLRKQIAQRAGVPPYALFTNEQLAEMVRRGVRSNADLGRIEGVGPSRIEKYGPPFLEILRAAPPPSPSQPPSIAPPAAEAALAAPKPVAGKA